MESFTGLAEKIQKLENEKISLRKEVEHLKDLAQMKALSLEQEVTEMRASVESLRELLSEDEMKQRPAPAANEASSKTPQKGSTKQASEMHEASMAQQVAPLNKKVESQGSAQREELYFPPTNDNPILAKLDGDERKVVELLLNHGGESSQKYVRTAANLSWLQANKVIYRLAEHGIINIKKKDGLDYLILTKHTN